AAVYGRDPNWGRIAAAAGYSGVSFNQNLLRVELGDTLLMDGGEPQSFDR
ncbi:arginine biosynthesis protein ArgJ, partial [Trifolium medium]|nr:arginine biosynthesis protein ArgJ [Trifolium medium]